MTNNNKIEKLTKEQQALIPVMRKEYTDLVLKSGLNVQESDIREGIDWLYSYLMDGNSDNNNNNNNKKEGIKPYIVIFDSYVGMQIGLNMLMRMSKIDRKNIDDKETREKLIYEIWKKLWFGEMGGSIRHKISKEDGGRISQEVEDQIFKSIATTTFQNCGRNVNDITRMNLERSMRDEVMHTILGDFTNIILNEKLNEPINDDNKEEQKILKHVYDSIVDGLNTQIGVEIGRRIREDTKQAIANINKAMTAAKEENNKLSYADHLIGIANWAGWIAFFDYCVRANILSPPEEKEVQAFIKFRDLMKKGIWTTCFFENIVLVCRLPVKAIKDDDTGRLHSTTGPAIQWRDGCGNYFLLGVDFSEKLIDVISNKVPELWKKITSGAITFKEVLNIENMEQRQVAIRLYGHERLVREMGGKLIDRSKHGNDWNELYQVDGRKLGTMRNRNGQEVEFPEKMLYVSYRDRSDDRRYMSPVPPDIKTANDAIAWKFYLTSQGYDLLTIES